MTRFLSEADEQRLRRYLRQRDQIAISLNTIRKHGLLENVLY